MEPSDNFPGNKSPRSRILGPRPTPLKVRKDPHKTRRPPLAPPQQQQQDHRQEPPPRAPVIIYTVTPKIIHTNPNDFMTLVQRLTGKSSSSSSLPAPGPPPPPPPPPYSYSSSAMSASRGTTTAPFGALSDDNLSSGSISPAARYAAMEMAANASLSSPEGRKQQLIMNEDNNQLSLGFMEGIDMGNHHHQQHQHRMIERPSFAPGILSPGPTSLPPISPSFFSPTPDPLAMPFFGDLSSIFQASPSMPSPYSSLDLFNNFSD